MAFDTNLLKTNPGDILGWPFLKIDYPTDPKKLTALLPPGIEPNEQSNVHLSIYCFPVPDEPEYGIVVSVDADYRGTPGFYALAYGIDQESAVYISKETNGQPKFLAEIEYYRMGTAVAARCTHHGYTFLEFAGTTAGALPLPESQLEHEWWIKVSRAVGGAEKSYDFPPHVVRVNSVSEAVFVENVDGELLLRDSPWDPYTDLLPMREQVSAQLVTFSHKSRAITLEGPLDPIAFWPHADTIGGSRWPGERGGPRRR